MKRALAIAVAVCTLGFAGFSQIALKGSWTASLCILPSVSLTSSLGLTYTVAGFDITSTTGFGAGGITSQSFALKGAFGPFSLTGGMWFDPATPAYQRSFVTTSFDFGGVAIGFTARHWAVAWSSGWGWGTTSPCGTQTPGLMYVFTTTISPITATITLRDCCTGTEFYNLNVKMTGLDLCCGIKYGIEFDFDKTGFDYVSFTGINVPICCGVSLDIAVKYGVDYKQLTPTFKFAGLGEACFTVWGNPTYTGFTWTGIEIYGFRIRCTIADCNYVELVNAFNVAEVNALLPSADRFLTRCGEFELVKIGFCGAGCCGGKYDVTLRIFFGSQGGLFDITRFVYTVNIPIMTNFTLNLTGTMYAVPTGPCNTDGSSFCLGWTFTF